MVLTGHQLIVNLDQEVGLGPSHGTHFVTWGKQVLIPCEVSILEQS
jgi:hypothetical protein